MDFVLVSSNDYGLIDFCFTLKFHLFSYLISHYSNRVHDKLLGQALPHQPGALGKSAH